MYKIGEFSKLAKTTVKTLRFYDESGLLKPAFVDPENGYRCYTAFAFYDGKMCGKAASKRPDACRMMIQCSQKGTRLAFGRRKTPPFIRTF